MMRTIYRLNGELDCFFTAVFLAYNDAAAYLTASSCMQGCIGETVVTVEVDEGKAARVIKKIKSIDATALFDVQTILCSSAYDSEQTAFLYVKELVKAGRAVRGHLSVECVRRAMDLRAQVLGEVHRLKGFLRFSETLGGVMYAPCSPDHDVVELLLPHFVGRLSGIPFAIHDVHRGKAALYNGRESVVMPVDAADVLATRQEEMIADLWRKYYRTVNIPHRKNERQRKGYMPRRYWQFLTEQPGRDEP